MTNPYPGTQWPADYQGCTITGQYLGLNGAPMIGSVSFNAAPDGLLDVGSKVIIVPISLTAVLDAEGRIPAGFVVPATDDPTINPTGWTYAVSENFSGGRKYNILAPMNTTIDLVNAAPVPAADGIPIYRGASGADGNPGILVLSADAEIPPATPSGTIIARTLT